MKRLLTLLTLPALFLACQANDIIKSDLCHNCLVWEHEYDFSIAETSKHYHIIVSHLITKGHLDMTDSLKDSKATKTDRSKLPFKAFEGFPNETQIYRIARKIYGKKNSDNIMAKGQNKSADDIPRATLGMHPPLRYTFNLTLEYPSRNTGTELGTEYMCRDMTRKYGFDKVWGGTWGSQGFLSDGNIGACFPAIYWKVAAYNKERNGYWIPHRDSAAGQANHRQFDASLKDLVAKLRFKPMAVFKESMEFK